MQIYFLQSWNDKELAKKESLKRIVIFKELSSNSYFKKVEDALFIHMQIFESLIMKI